MPQVSIVVPIYKVETWLPRCLESIAAQTFRDFECILVDDGSPDGCGAICDGWAARDARFRAIHKPNGGLSSARNAGLAVAKADWVVFCDSDDALHPQTLELALSVQAQAPPNTLVCWKHGPFPEALPQLHPSSESQTAAQLFDAGDFPSAWSKLWNRQLLCAFDLRFDETVRWAEDLDFTTRYLLAILNKARQVHFLFIPQVLYFYEQQRPGSLTVNYFPAKLSCEFQQLPQLLELFHQLCDNDLSLWAPFCRHELFVLLGFLSDCARFETETPPRERWCKIRACLALPCMRQFLSLCHRCRVWPAMTFCARHGLARLCVFLARNCYKPWYTGTIRAWLWLKNKFYWGWQAVKGLFARGKG
ncbi:glycosyltransferase family 2 protein [Allofournierella sp.]|uniref:glycosyltransferase family 2 protein n=1 Tax=Allofournierella sp. TaxID=1940256 RepID=UPI003AB6F515